MHDRISQYNVDITLNYLFLPTVTLDFSNLAFPAIISNFDPDMNYMKVFAVLIAVRINCIILQGATN